jgi:hypothetical protein
MLNRSKISFIFGLFCLVFSAQIFASNGGDEPIILKQPEDISQCIGGNGKLTVTLNEGVKATVQWQYSVDAKHWMNVEGATALTHTPEAKTARITFFRVAVTTIGKDPQISVTTPVTVDITDCKKKL